MSTRVSVVIPVLNEAESLRRLLPTLAPKAHEVVVADGGSEDGSPAVAQRFGARVVMAPPGRGVQLNRGARATSGEALLFVHADTLPPPRALDEVGRAVDGGYAGGGFLIRFENPKPVFRLGERVVNLRTRMFRIPLGDQAQFASRPAFERLGGFREWPFLEDVDFIRRLRRAGRVKIVRRAVSTSARRFEQHGVARTVARNWTILILFALGVSPQRLARLYPHAR